LTGKGVAWGCVGRAREVAFNAHQAALRTAMERASQEGLPAVAMDRLGLVPATDGRWRSVLALAGNDNISWASLCEAFPWLAALPERTAEQLRTDARYAGYLHRQQAEARLSRREDSVDLEGISFEDIGGLSTEIREKLTRARPESLGVAARIQGMTPAALASIAAFARKRSAA
jgi:tRNA uridine 5-carboxymethylaminomethyl modification enzyme